jgi:ribonuclease BN (tRNA processing enzyme)
LSGRKVKTRVSASRRTAHNIAAERRHLTALQAGHIAKQARVGRLIPFHFSARYRDRAEELTREAEEAFSVSGSPKLPD